MPEEKHMQPIISDHHANKWASRAIEYLRESHEMPLNADAPRVLCTLLSKHAASGSVGLTNDWIQMPVYSVERMFNAHAFACRK